jgi:hypothetical protein
MDCRRRHFSCHYAAALFSPACRQLRCLRHIFAAMPAPFILLSAFRRHAEFRRLPAAHFRLLIIHLSLDLSDFPPLARLTPLISSIALLRLFFFCRRSLPPSIRRRFSATPPPFAAMAQHRSACRACEAKGGAHARAVCAQQCAQARHSAQNAAQAMLR